MAHFEWDDSLSVHDSEVDEQHKAWLAILNKLHNIVLEGDSASLRTAGAEALKEMQEYTYTHFKTEEEYMQSINYPSIHDHRRKHKDFDNQIYVYCRDVRDGRTVLNTEIIHLLKYWLFEHIQTEDKKLAMFAKLTKQKSMELV